MCSVKLVSEFVTQTYRVLIVTVTISVENKINKTYKANIY